MKTKHRRLTKDERQAMQEEALSRATQGIKLTNFPAIFQGFMEKGIPEEEIKPRENVFTYNAWRALGRQVRKGKKRVKEVIMAPIWDKSEAKQNDADNSLPDKDKKRGTMRPWTATVFHVSQTDPMNVKQLDQRDQAHAARIDQAPGKTITPKIETVTAPLETFFNHHNPGQRRSCAGPFGG